MERPDHPASTGAYAFRGKRLRLRNVEQSLKEHLMKWSPYVAEHGLLVIELHTVAPEDAEQLQGKLPATAYDATHGFSDQYILEIPVYDAMAEEAGLRSEEAVGRNFNKKPALCPEGRGGGHRQPPLLPGLTVNCIFLKRGLVNKKACLSLPPDWPRGQGGTAL